MVRRASRWLVSSSILVVLGGGCTTDGPGGVDERSTSITATDRAEEAPDTLWPAPPLLAPELFGERAEAARRHTERVARIGTRVVAREEVEAVEVDFARLDEGELFQARSAPASATRLVAPSGAG